MRIRSRVQELDETQLLPNVNIKELGLPPASFFDPHSKKLFFVTELEEIVQYSPITFQEITKTMLEMSSVYDDCFELLPCQNEEAFGLGNLKYAVAICKQLDHWVASVVEYFHGNQSKAEFMGNFKITGSHKLVEAKCNSSKLFFLDFDEEKQKSSLLIYDLYVDIQDSKENLTLLANITSKDLNLSDSITFTSFDLVKIGNFRKLLFTE